MEMRSTGIFSVILAALACLVTDAAMAWGADGHRVVGSLAMNRLSPEAHDRLREIVGSEDPGRMIEWCTWPDAYRNTEEGGWSAPQHYINIPAEAAGYERRRDCKGGMCSAEAFKRYAGELADDALPDAQRRQAWGWLCHLAGDMHQPLHNGYRHDRGGNDFTVVYRGREMDLHTFWDSAMIRANYPDASQLGSDLAPLVPPVPSAWRPGDTDDWVRESHELARGFGYPETSGINRDFAAERWLLARSRLALAASRLAAVINTALGANP